MNIIYACPTWSLTNHYPATANCLQFSSMATSQQTTPKATQLETLKYFIDTIQYFEAATLTNQVESMERYQKQPVSIEDWQEATFYAYQRFAAPCAELDCLQTRLDEIPVRFRSGTGPYEPMVVDQTKFSAKEVQTRFESVNEKRCMKMIIKMVELRREMEEKLRKLRPILMATLAKAWDQDWYLEKTKTAT